MTDKVQKIRQEIERRINISLEQGYTYSAAQLKRVMDFIDSLPEENHFEDKSEMVSDDLDIAATSIIKRLGGMEKDDCVSEHELKIFKAAIDWQKKKDQETIELAEDHAMLAGMNKMKEEIMKDAVDAFVHQGLYSKYVKECDDGALANVLKKHNSGDKVKIIIVKTEQQ